MRILTKSISIIPHSRGPNGPESPDSNPPLRTGAHYMLWCWMDMQGDECLGPGLMCVDRGVLVSMWRPRLGPRLHHTHAPYGPCVSRTGIFPSVCGRRTRAELHIQDIRPRMLPSSAAPRQRASCTHPCCSFPCRGLRAHGTLHSPGPMPGLAPLVKPHPPPGLHSSSLYRRVRCLEPEPEGGVVGVCKVGVGISLELADVGSNLGEVSDYVSGGICVVSGSGLWVLGHELRRLMRNCGQHRRSRTLMLVPNLRPKVVAHSGSRLLLGLIVRVCGRLVARSSTARHPEARPPSAALRERSLDARRARSMAPFPQRAGLLAFRLLPPALLFPRPLLPKPPQPAYPRPGAPTARFAEGFRPRDLGAFGRLPRDGYHPHPGGRASEGLPQGTFRWAGELREVPLEDRVGLRVQGGAGGRSARRGEGLRVGPGKLRRTADRRRDGLPRPPQRLPGRQGLLLARVGALLAGSLRGFGRRHAQGQQREGLAGGRSTLGGGQAAAHRAGYLAAEGPLLPGAPSGEDAGRPARPLGRQGGSLHLRAASQLFARSAVTPPRGSFDLTSYASVVLGMRHILIGKRIYVHGVPLHTSWFCPYCCATVDTASVTVRGTGSGMPPEPDMVSAAPVG